MIKELKMRNKKLIIGILSFLLVAFGIVFAFLPHELHELVTFWLEIPHFLHFVMGFFIVGVGLACMVYSIKKGTFSFEAFKYISLKKSIIENRKKIIGIAAFIFIFLA